MSPNLIVRLAALLISLGYLSGCATSFGPAQPTSENPAVIALLDTARTNIEKEQFSAAAASLERALRIEPKNPLLWQELSRLHLREGDYQQAESFAARSNSWAGNDRRLLAENWRIISAARAKRGDDAGAQYAAARAQELED